MQPYKGMKRTMQSGKENTKQNRLHETFSSTQELFIELILFLHISFVKTLVLKYIHTQLITMLTVLVLTLYCYGMYGCMYACIYVYMACIVLVRKNGRDRLLWS